MPVGCDDGLLDGFELGLVEGDTEGERVVGWFVGGGERVGSDVG